MGKTDFLIAENILERSKIISDCFRPVNLEYRPAAEEFDFDQTAMFIWDFKDFDSSNITDIIDFFHQSLNQELLKITYDFQFNQANKIPAINDANLISKACLWVALIDPDKFWDNDFCNQSRQFHLLEFMQAYKRTSKKYYQAGFDLKQIGFSPVSLAVNRKKPEIDHLKRDVLIDNLDRLNFKSILPWFYIQYFETGAPLLKPVEHWPISLATLHKGKHRLVNLNIALAIKDIKNLEQHLVLHQMLIDYLDKLGTNNDLEFCQQIIEDHFLTWQRNQIIDYYLRWINFLIKAKQSAKDTERG